MQRYFFQFDYFGTRFQGLQKQFFRGKEVEKMTTSELQSMYEKDEGTIQGALESAVWNVVRPHNPVKLITSSRTDKGVHALLNTAHVDLCPSTVTGKYCPPREITKMVNWWLLKKDLDIRVKKTLAVPPSFHCRYDVAKRCYLYRIVVTEDLRDSSKRKLLSKSKMRKAYKNKKEANDALPPFLSPLEQGRYCELRFGGGELFDVELFNKTLDMMKGVHNFSNFSKMPGHYRYFTVNGQRLAIRKTSDEMTKEITKIEVIRQPPPLSLSIFPAYGLSGTKFLDVLIEGKSFLHNQIRRMVGAAISVASGRIPIQKVEELLYKPEEGWDSKIFICPSVGLYLANIEYKEGALDNACESTHDMLNLDKVKILSDNTQVDQNDLGDQDTIKLQN